MARKRQSETVEAGTIDLTKELGLTSFRDTKFSSVADRLPTMIPQLDYILGGGLPFGRMVEVIGKNSSGKSTFAVHLTKIAQLLKVPTLWIDVEGTADPDRLAELGVNPDAGDVFMVEPALKKDGTKDTMTVERVAEELQRILPVINKTGKPILIIWDSVAQTAAEKEIERGVGNQQPGIKAKAMAQFSQIIAPLMTNSKALFVAINQARDEMGSMFGGIDSPGGHALHHWASLRLEVQKASKIENSEINAFGVEEKSYIGHIMRIKTLKSKVSRPQQKAEMYLMADSGLDLEENIYRACFATNKQYGFISGGAWKAYTTDAGQEIKFNSEKNWVDFLKSEEGQPVRDELFAKMMARSFPNGYAPYKNEEIDICQIPLYKYVKDYMETHKEEAQPVEEQTAPVSATDVSDLLDQIK